jgi:hypothetical protein
MFETLLSVWRNLDNQFEDSQGTHYIKDLAEPLVEKHLCKATKKSLFFAVTKCNDIALRQ